MVGFFPSSGDRRWTRKRLTFVASGAALNVLTSLYVEFVGSRNWTMI